MFAKHVSELTYSDIDDLVNVRQEKEGYHLDYKGEIAHPDKAKKELSKDISAFANTGGGYLIIGVDKNYKIVGIDQLIQNKSIDEWLNQILSSNIEPPVFYHDPKIIDIPNNPKIIVIIHVPESTKKPHMVTDSNYHIRINDSSKPANHNQIRDMYDFSKNRTDEFYNYLKKRNLDDENNENFGLNKNSVKLFSHIPNQTNRPKPFVLFSLIPKYPNEEKINLTINELKSWLNNNRLGYFPLISMPLFYVSHDYDLRIDGIVLKLTENQNLQSYFEVLSNGYIEGGISNTITYSSENERSKKPEVFMSLTGVIGYEMLLLGFAKKFYDMAKYYDEVLLQISFVNVLSLKLFDFNSNYDSTRYDWGDIRNKQHPNFKLNFRFNPKTLSENDILQNAKLHSEKICRAFGLEQDLCFVNDKLDIRRLNRTHF